ncbi:reverse transcriptase domain-containing protein [Tanacetum coccineum]|uniref:Reverse transcriptase domain-containing protein n=1 Tax=Tanacetum coccineum TaxID=301880 RepID=A0ABQ5BKL8_9ASTR
MQNALADLGASINLMPYSVWKNLSLPELTPTCMTLELADRSISEPIGIAEDVYVTVGKFQFPADFVVVDFEPDPRVPLILGRSFLKTSRALIDVYEGEITLRVGREAITFNLDQTSRYTANYNHMTANRIDVIDMACENLSRSSWMDPSTPEVDPTYIDPDGTFFSSKAILNSDPVTTPPPNQEIIFRKLENDLKFGKRQGALHELQKSIKNEENCSSNPRIPHGKDYEPRFSVKGDFTNYHAGNFIVKGMSSQQKASFYKDVNTLLLGIDPFLCKIFRSQMIPSMLACKEALDILKLAIMDPPWTSRCKSHHQTGLENAGILWPLIYKDAHELDKNCDSCQRQGKISQRDEMPQNSIQVCEIFDVWGIDFMGPFPSSRGNKYILVAVDLT